MKNYNHQKIEKKWQKVWVDKKTYQTLPVAKAKAKKLKPYYVLDMFPYPSGAGLHVGHPRGYIASDVFARMKRMQGFNVLHPMGFDSFGLPAEQYAIKTGKSPGPFTNKLVEHYKHQLSILGFSYDWDRQVETHNPEYYKWTQWIFLKIYNSYYNLAKNKAEPIEKLEQEFAKNGNEKILAVCDADTPTFSKTDWKNFSDLEKQNVLMKYRLAYEGYAEVNWCAELGTVLANDEIVEKDGKMVSERGEYPVVKKQMRQWFMRITAYADRLLDGLETIDWPNNIKEIQKNWIGKSEGSEIDFKLTTGEQIFGEISVFTTRADTLFGVTYVVLAPDHPMVSELKHSIKNWNQVAHYIEQVKTKSDEDRVAAKEKTGVPLHGVFAVNPACRQAGLQNEQVPVWVADYVLASYGTGAVMAVPAHDERDFEFAKKYDLPIKEVVIQDVNDPMDLAPVEKNEGAFGVLVNKKGEILLQYDGAVKHWRLPGGSLDQGESPAETALREVIEETGYKNITLKKTLGSLHVYFYKMRFNKIFDRRGYGFVFDGSNAVLEEPILSESEKTAQLRHEWVEPRKALELFKSNEFELGEVQFIERFINNFESFVNDGVLVNSGKFDGMSSQEARRAITEFVGGKLVTKYRMRDAIFARQRYWGEPIPLVHTDHETASTWKKHDEAKSYLMGAKDISDDELRALDISIAQHTASGARGLLIPVKSIKAYEKLVSEKLQKGFWCEYLANEIVFLFKDKKGKVMRMVLNSKNEQKILSLCELYSKAKYGSIWKMLQENAFYADWIELGKSYSLIETIPESKLPLKLPNVKSYAPTGTGESPLAGVKSWVGAGYETNTMPGWAGSSWYFLRYTDPKNKKVFASKQELDYWFGKKGGVDMYVGGSEHATGHLLYSRFWHKFLKDLGYMKSEEPFAALRNQGMILGADGVKMSKRYGNIVNPDDVVRDLGADTLRVYEAFMGPFVGTLPWSTDGIVGARRFVERVWKLADKVGAANRSGDGLQKTLHKTIKKVSEDIQEFNFNTAVSAMMILVNEMEKSETISEKEFALFLQILAPFAPHVTDELWNQLGNKGSIHHALWPKYDQKLVVDDTVKLGIQVNGKVRAEIEIARDASEADVKNMVLQIPDVVKWIEGKEVKKFIYIPGKIISVVVG